LLVVADLEEMQVVVAVAVAAVLVDLELAQA